MCKEVENQFDFDAEMKQAEELFEKLKTFDFVEDTIEIEGNPKKTKKLKKEYREQDSIYKKWMLYKASGVLTKNISEAYTEIRKYFDEGKNDEKEIIMELHDPDGEIKDGEILGGSQLLQYIYKKLWSELTAQEFMKHFLNDDQNTWICSDTMTSAQQRMNDFLQVIKDSDFENVRTGIGERQQYSLRLCIELYFKDKNEFKKKLKSMENFLNHWHMLGNYCPVPRHFNCARSGCAANYDYWDLTLMKIKEYYNEIGKLDDKGDDEWKILGEELLHGAGNALACKKWLDYFGSWKEFIEKNYMQDFVNGNYEVKPFFDGHNWNKPTPKTLKEFNDLFQNASEMIKNRTERIVNALTAEYKQEQLLNGIMAKLKAIGAN